MRLHEYFDRTYLINLDSRPERLSEATIECNKYGIVFERFQACDGETEIDRLIPSASGYDEIGWNKRAAGLCVSHIRLLGQCQKDNVNSVLIMEDDVEFNPQMNIFIDDVMKQIPEDWESIFWGLGEGGTTQLSKNIYLIKSGVCCHCFALRKDVFQYVLDILSPLNDPADIIYNNYLFPRGKSYLVKPFLAWQRASISSIRGYYKDYKFLRPPESLSFQEIEDLCTRVHILEERVSKYENRTKSNPNERLSKKKILELCGRTFELEEKLWKYEKNEKILSLESLSQARLQEICTRVFILEDQLENLENQIEKDKQEKNQFPFRQARSINKLINNILPKGSKRRNLAQRVYNLFVAP